MGEFISRQDVAFTNETSVVDTIAAFKIGWKFGEAALTGNLSD